MPEDFGVTESVSLALGGMIGGGIFAVLGVVAQITRGATWFAFVLAGLVAFCAGYSYVKLNRICDQAGGSVTFVQAIVGNSTLAGMIGWTLLVGYVGSMAMYAFAFGEFAVGLRAVPDAVTGVPLRPVVSVLAVAGFVALNLAGARATGMVETLLVGAKIAVLLALGVGGLLYALVLDPRPLNYGFGRFTSAGPIMAAAISFVAFQGWQLLFYDQGNIENAADTIRKAVYVAIPTAVAIYVLVAVVTVNLASQALRTHPHVALARAAEPILGYVGFAGLGFLIVSLAALFSTGSAINATLFSTSYFAKGMLSDDLLPDRVGDASADGIPERSLVALGAITAAFTAVGSLNAITSFASLAFIVVFGGMCYLALRQRNRETVFAAVPAVGLLGTALFFPLMFYHFYRAEPRTFVAVIALSVGLLLVELLYFERDVLEAEIERIETPL